MQWYAVHAALVCDVPGLPVCRAARSVKSALGVRNWGRAEDMRRPGLTASGSDGTLVGSVA